jgi:hypothetical protein
MGADPQFSVGRLRRRTTAFVDRFSRVEGSDLVSISAACPKIVKLLIGEGVAANGAAGRATAKDFIL